MKHKLLLTLSLVGGFQIALAQNLTKPITLNIKQQSLKDALTIIGNEGDFNFSYNARVINTDSVVSIYASQKPVVEILRLLFNASYEFKESGNYVIIRKRPITTTTVVANAPVDQAYYTVSGYVVDDETGDKIPNATIYEKTNLISTITDDKGYFALRLKSKYNSATLFVSKVDYLDTSIGIQNKYNQAATIAMARIPQRLVKADDYKAPSTAAELPPPPADSVITALDLPPLQADKLVKAFISRQARVNAENLNRFITTRKFQLSLLPMIGTHGKMNAHVVNYVSVNVLGGYSAGTNGVEVGGLFNACKGDAKYFQAAGIFNSVGGSVTGFQAGGIANKVAGSSSSFQVAGICNTVKVDMEGVQVAGILNSTLRTCKGAQVGLINKCNRLHGVQIGLVNIVSHNSGTSLGLINISKGRGNRRRIGFILRVPRIRKIS
jgi:hypothetical protein